MDEMMSGWIDWPSHEWIDENTDNWMFINGRLNKRVDGCMEGRMYRRKDGKNGCEDG